MRKMLYLAAVLLPLGLSVSSPALAESDLLTGKSGVSEATFGVYVDDASGNQDYVREYDGRNFNGWGVESVDAYGYSGPYQYWFGARSLITGDEEISFDLSLRNELGVRLSTNALTHRLGRTPGINPYLSGIINPGDGRALSGINTAVTPNAPFGDAFLELSPQTDLVLHRRVNDFGIRQHIGERFALNADWWQETEKGARQVLFYNARRYSVPVGIDRSTSQSTLGGDLRIGADSVINYMLGSTDFSDAGKPVVPGTLLDSSRFPSVKTDSSIVKARSRLSDKLYFTGVHSNRKRSNVTSTVPASNPAVPLGARIETESTNLAMTYLATDVLSLNARWRTYDLDNYVPPIPNATAPTNFPMSRKVDSKELGASFNGIKNTFLRLGFEHRDTERRSGELRPAFTGLAAEMIRESSTSDILRFGVRYNPFLKLSLSGNAEKWDTDHSAYFGEPTDRTKANMSATYTVRDNFVIYGDYSYANDENNEIREAGPIPDTATTEEEAHIRELAAGQGYRNKFRTMDLGAWYGITDKLSLDLNMAKITTDASALWIIGFEPAYPQHLPAETQAYSADNSQWSLGLNYRPKPKWQVYGRFLNSSSEGRASFTSLAGGLTLPQGWVPVDVSEKRWTLGFGYDVSATDRVMLDFSTSDWTDKVNPTNDGRYNLWRLAWSTGF